MPQLERIQTLPNTSYTPKEWSGTDPFRGSPLQARAAISRQVAARRDSNNNQGRVSRVRERLRRGLARPGQMVMVQARRGDRAQDICHLGVHALQEHGRPQEGDGVPGPNELHQEQPPEN